MTEIALVARWFVKTGQEDSVRPALAQLAADVQAQEPDTLAYLVHFPYSGDPRLQSLPPVGPTEVVFFERYRSADAFLAHVSGPVFTAFVAAHGDDFTGVGGKPFTTVEFLAQHAGFVRGPDTTAVAPVNRHPGVMFEIIAQDQAMIQRFYTAVFGWQYQIGTGGFAYIHFPAGTPPLLGGIGQAVADTPGFAPGHNFYLLVDDLAAMIAQAVAAGGQVLMPPTAVDGYHFAMFTDPEGNPVGLVAPFLP